MNGSAHSRPARTGTALAMTFGAALLLGLPLEADAGDVYLFNEDVPSAEEIARIMFPEPERKTRGLSIGSTKKEPEIRTRGIRFETAEPASTARWSPDDGNGASAPAPSGSAVGFNITFAFNSAELTADALPALDQLGQALNLPEAAGKRVQIAGHADASGDAAYNLGLSESRADAVRAYLARRHGVAPERLRIVGYGETYPLPGIDPFDGLNRRVEFQPLD
ncbi:MAG: OmpA family protein [Geminicoccaceae bacterium]